VRPLERHCYLLTSYEKLHVGLVAIRREIHDDFKFIDDVMVGKIRYQGSKVERL